MDSIEKKAIKFVMEYEKKQGKNPVDVSRDGVGYDIKSNSHLIEVKGQKSIDSSEPRQNWLIFNHRCLRILQQNPKEYFVYFVFNIQNEKSLEESKPRLIIIPGEEIIKNFDFSLIKPLDDIMNKTRKSILRFEPQWEIHLPKEKLMSFEEKKS